MLGELGNAPLAAVRELLGLVRAGREFARQMGAAVEQDARDVVTLACSSNDEVDEMLAGEPD